MICLICPVDPVLDGCMAITFETVSAAATCSNKLNGRLFDGQKIMTHINTPVTSNSSFDSSAAIQSSSHNKVGLTYIADDLNANGSTQSNVLRHDDVNESKCEADEANADDVDDFLNSLL